MVVCADTSFLFSLYGNDVHTPRAIKWANRRRAPVTVSVFNEYELGNALRLAEFRKALAAGESALFLAQFEADRSGGRVLTRICNLADVVGEAQRLSATHTLGAGHRGFDILHVAGALIVGATEFLTFDANQKKLAQSEGLTVPL